MLFWDDDKWKEAFSEDSPIYLEDGQTPADIETDQNYDMDVRFEFDAPRFYDFEFIKTLVDSYGPQVIEEEARIYEQEYVKWFQSLHLDHEHDEERQAVNLLAQLPPEFEDPVHLAKFASSFVDELGFLNDDAEPKLKQSSIVLGMKRPRAGTTRHLSMKINQPSRQAAAVTATSSSTTQRRKPPTSATPDRASTERFIRQNVTRRNHIADDTFLEAHDALPGVIRVQPAICRAPTTMKAETKVRKQDLENLLKSHNQQTRVSRAQKSGPIPHSTRPPSQVVPRIPVVSKAASSSVPKPKDPPKTASQQAQLFKQVRDARKQEDELMDLLKKHNERRSAAMKRTR